MDSWPHKYWRLSFETSSHSGVSNVTVCEIRFDSFRWAERTFLSIELQDWLFNVMKSCTSRTEFFAHAQTILYLPVTISFRFWGKPRKMNFSTRLRMPRMKNHGRKLCSTHSNLIDLFWFPGITWHFHIQEHRSEAYFSKISLGSDVDSNKVENTTKQCMTHTWSRLVHFMK